MKFRIIYTLMSLLFVVGISMNFSRGPAGASDIDRTGSPLSGSNDCTQCHTGNSFSPDMTIKLMDGSDEVTNYVAGKTYNIVFDVSATSNPSGYGIQAVTLDASNTGVGNFMNAPPNTQITDLAGIQYFEHGKLVSMNPISVEWTAPAMGTGDVTIYAAGMAANGNGGNSGDGVSTKNLIISEGVSSTGNLSDISFDVYILSNPVGSQLPIKIESPASMMMNMTILDLNGRVGFQKETRVAQGENILNIEVSNLNKGIYFLQMTDGESVVTKKLLKL